MSEGKGREAFPSVLRLSFSPVVLLPEVLRYGVVDSTNRLAREIREDGRVFWAEMQTAGRGRRGTRWESAPSLGLWFSVSLFGPAEGLMQIGALSVYRVLCAEGFAARMKWPNDVYVEGKKICGVLVEHRRGWNALGIGVNVNHTVEDFPPELREHATSLRRISGRAWDRTRLLEGILQDLDLRLKEWREGALSTLMDEWVAALGLVGKTVRIGGAEGVVVSVEGDGTLVLRTERGTQRIPMPFLE